MKTRTEGENGSAVAPAPNPFRYPALRSLGDLADHAPILIQDTREQLPLKFTRLECRVATLLSGDYSILSLESEFSIERKGSIDEVAANCVGANRSRFEREMQRLKACRFRRLLIVGSEEAILAHRYHSTISPKSVMGSLYAWQARFDLPFVFVDSPEAAAKLLELWAVYFASEYIKTCNELFRGAERRISP